MTNQISEPLVVAARTLPVPAHLSPEARASFLVQAYNEPMPPPDDKEAWRAHVLRLDAALLPYVEQAARAVTASVLEKKVGSAKVYEIIPEGVAADDPRVYLDIHGGALVYGGGAFCRNGAVGAAALMEAKVWSVDYRMPPDFPYPAALDDCLAAYSALLNAHRPQDIVIGGGSAGGNLVAATILRARDEGLPLPAAAILLTPEVDLTESGDSFCANLGVDNVLTGSLMPANLLYADGADLTHPYLSPLFGDFSQGFPPTFLSTGTRDLFLSNTVRMHAALRATDVEADLYIIDAASHSGFAGAPEAAARQRELRRFLDRHWPAV